MSMLLISNSKLEIGRHLAVFVKLAVSSCNRRSDCGVSIKFS